jgi:hypothetical protein
VFVFAVGLVRWHKNAEGAPVHLPDTLSGGYTALSLESAYANYSPSPAAAGGQAPPTAAQVIDQVKAAESSAATGLAQLPDAAAEKIYGTVGAQGLTNLIEASVFRAGGGPMTPADLGVSSQSVAKYGDVYCSSAANQTGGADTTCQRAEQDLTVQLYSTTLAGAALAPYADEVYKDLTHSTW